MDHKQQLVDDSESCFSEIEWSFCDKIEQYTKLGFTTTLQNKIGSQVSGQPTTNLARSYQKRNSKLVMLWRPYFKMPMKLCFSNTMKKASH